MPVDPDPRGELAAIDAADLDRRRLEHYKGMASSNQAALFAAHARNQPWTDPKTLMALTNQGIPADSPLALAIAEKKAKKKSKGIGGFLGAVGTVVSTPAKMAMSLAEPVTSRLDDILKPVTRAAFTVLSAPLEEVQGLARAGIYGVRTGQWGEAMNHAGGSTLRLALGDLMEGKDVDLGSGFFQGGKLAKEQEELARRLKINGRWISVGRELADIAFDEGDFAFNMVSGVIDGAIAIGADPTNLALGGLSQVRKVNKLLAPGMGTAEAFLHGAAKAGAGGKVMRSIANNAGLVRGRTTEVIAQQFDEFLQKPELQKLSQVWAEEKDFQKIWAASGKKMDVRMVRAIQEADNPETVQALIRNAVLQPDPKTGRVLRTKAELGTLGQVDTGILGPASDHLARARSAHSEWGARGGGPRLLRRQMQQMPHSAINLMDLDKHPGRLNEAVEQLDRFQRMVGIDEATISKNNEALASIRHAGEAYDVIVKKVVGEDTAGVLSRMGWDRDNVSRMTKLWANSQDDMVRYSVDRIGRNVEVPGVGVDEFGLPLVKPQLLVEALNGAVPLPDPRELKRMTTQNAGVRALVNSTGYKVPVAAMDKMMSKAWRPLTLLRGAWTVRVIGEEQVRLEMQGMDAPIFHPASLISMIVNRKQNVDVTGNLLKDSIEHQDSMSRVRRMLNPEGRQFVGDFVTYDRSSPEFARSLVGELAELHNDAIANMVAKHGPDHAKHYLMNTPEGRGLAQKYSDVLVNPTIVTPQGMSAYVDGIAERLAVKTGNKEELLELVRRGRLELKDEAGVVTGRYNLLEDDAAGAFKGANRKVTDWVRTKVHEALDATDQGVTDNEWALALPEKVKGQRTISMAGDNKGYLDRATQFMFNTLMSRPTNTLSRSPAFKQYYWEEVERLLPHMDVALQERTLAQAERAWKGVAGAGNEQMRRLRNAAKKGGVESAPPLTADAAKIVKTGLTPAEVDTLAKGHALDSTRALLYDITEKGVWADNLRNVMPFAEAWKEVLTRWAKIGFEDPRAARRLQQTVTGARGAGFFRKDENGEEVFVYPGSQWAMEKLTNVPAPMTGAVSGLNLFSTSVLPGFGPVVQMSAAKIIPNKPQFDDLRSVFMPFGDPTEQGVVESLMPTWMKRMKTAFASPESDRLFANTQIDVMRYLQSTGEFDTSTAEGQQELFDEATERARALFVARSVATLAGAPAPPKAEAVVKDPSGNTVVASMLTKRLQELQNDPKVGFDQAIQQFMSEFGDGAIGFLQGKSYAVVPNAPGDEKGGDWLRAHPDVADKFPNVYGYFAPQGGERDYASYLRQIKTGEREQLTADEVFKLANDKYASMIYYTAKDSIPNPNKTQEAMLRKLRETLMQKYPGFGTAKAGLPERAETPQLVDELKASLEDPLLADTEAGQALAVYMEARDLVQAQAEAAGYASFGEAKDFASQRRLMRKLGDMLGRKYPQFALMFDRVLDREMKEDEEGGVSLGAATAEPGFVGE